MRHEDSRLTLLLLFAHNGAQKLGAYVKSGSSLIIHHFIKAFIIQILNTSGSEKKRVFISE